MDSILIQNVNCKSSIFCNALLALAITLGHIITVP